LSAFHTSKDLALGLGIEAGELAELFLWRKEEEIRAAFEQPEFRQRLGGRAIHFLVIGVRPEAKIYVT
jgi:hypothetical protein